MTVIESVHAEHDARFVERGGRRVVDHYGRPARVHRAVRKVVGVIEWGVGVLVVAGEDRHAFVDDAVSNRVPETEGEGCYALLLDPDGSIRTDLYVFNAGERLLLFTPPGEAAPLAEDWRGKVFIQDVTIDRATEDFATFGVHGPKATEKVASVCTASAPADQLTFERGSMGEAGVTVIRTDALAGERGFLVVCGVDDAADVYDTLENRGLNAAPFGYRTWEMLTLEAGTPLFETELAGRIPNALGLRNAVDFEKGCFVGQEIVSRIENRGSPPGRLVGLSCTELPAAGDAVQDGDDSLGEITRAVESPARDGPIAFAVLDGTGPPAETPVSIESTDGPVDAEIEPLPFVEGSERSARIPDYD